MMYQQMNLPGLENPSSDPQPKPVPNEYPAIWDLVIDDMKNRDLVGQKKYGTPLQPFNGRNMLVDLYQELLDACCYIRGLIYEESTKGTLQLHSEKEVEELRKHFLEHKDDPPILVLSAFPTANEVGYCPDCWGSK